MSEVVIFKMNYEIPEPESKIYKAHLFSLSAYFIKTSSLSFLFLSLLIIII